MKWTVPGRLCVLSTGLPSQALSSPPLTCPLIHFFSAPGRASPAGGGLRGHPPGHVGSPDSRCHLKEPPPEKSRAEPLVTKSAPDQQTADRLESGFQGVDGTLAGGPAARTARPWGPGVGTMGLGAETPGSLSTYSRHVPTAQPRGLVQWAEADSASGEAARLRTCPGQKCGVRG